MEIDVLQLKIVIDRLFAHVIETRGVGRVDLGSDYYWNVPSTKKYEMSQEPDDLDVGRLSDDWQMISRLLEPSIEPVAFQLTEVAPLLRRLGEVLGAELASRGG
jgi:hypothetical protein